MAIRISATVDRVGFGRPRPTPAWQQDRPTSECLGVVHVPKCGGSAIRTALVKVPACYAGPYYYDHTHFGSEDLYHGVSDGQRTTIVDAKDLAPIVKDKTLVLGHYSTNTLLRAGCTSLAVLLREPRSRLLSLYRFWQAQSPEERSSWGRWGSELVSQADGPLDQFLRSPATWPAIDNAVARQLVGIRRLRARVLPFRSRRWRTGYRRLLSSLSIAEWSEQSQTFVERTAELVGSSSVPQVTAENVTDARGDQQVITSETRQLLQSLTKADSELVEALMDEGLLSRRSASELEEAFERTALRLGFQL